MIILSTKFGRVRLCSTAEFYELSKKERKRYRLVLHGDKVRPEDLTVERIEELLSGPRGEFQRP